MEEDNYTYNMSESILHVFDVRCETPEEQEAADRLLTAICGYRLQTLIDRIIEYDAKGHHWESL